MARKRMIDPEIWNNLNFGNLTAVAKILYIGIFSHADDEGFGQWHDKLFKGNIFKYNDEITLIEIKSAMNEVQKNMNIKIYTVDDNDYYTLPNWKKWQTINRPTPSKLPPPQKFNE